MTTSSTPAALRPGLTGSAELIVEPLHTACSLGSGQMDVLATPAMIALLEAAACQAVDPLLPAGHLTIGTHLAVHHYGATPVGMRVIATAELTGIDGRTLTFRVTATDEQELIGEGTHQRMLTASTSFERLLQRKIRRKKCL